MPEPLRKDPLVPVIAATLDKVTRILATRDHTCDVLREAYRRLDTQTRDNALGMVARDVRRALEADTYEPPQDDEVESGRPSKVPPIQIDGKLIRVTKLPTEEEAAKETVKQVRAQIADVMRQKAAKKAAEEEAASTPPIAIAPDRFVRLTEDAFDNLLSLMRATAFSENEAINHAINFMWTAMQQHQKETEAPQP